MVKKEEKPFKITNRGLLDGEENTISFVETVIKSIDYFTRVSSYQTASNVANPDNPGKGTRAIKSYIEPGGNDNYFLLNNANTNIQSCIMSFPVMYTYTRLYYDYIKNGKNISDDFINNCVKAYKSLLFAKINKYVDKINYDLAVSNVGKTIGSSGTSRGNNLFFGSLTPPTSISLKKDENNTKGSIVYTYPILNKKSGKSEGYPVKIDFWDAELENYIISEFYKQIAFCKSR